MSREFSGRDYVKAAFKRVKLDRFAAYPILGAVSAKFYGITIREFLTDAAKFAAAQVAAYERFEPDIVVMLPDLVLEPEAMGQTVDFFDDRMCQQRGYLVDEKGKLAHLSVPEPQADGRLPYYLEACQRIAQSGIGAAIGSVINGPWSLACELRGAENLLLDTYDDPEFVHSLLEFCTQVVNTFGAAVSETGVGISLSEAPSSCSLISPKIYREFILPYHKRVVEFFKQQRKGITIHVCGYIDPIMEMLLSTGAAAISMDAPSSLARMLSLADETSVIIGNVATSLFLDGTKEAIQQAVRDCLETADGHKAYILASGCELPIPTPPENVDYFMQAARQTR